MTLVEAGFFESRARAAAAIAAGLVTADGVRVAKPSSPLRPGAAIVASAPHPYVSRGGVKLAAGLDAFAIDAAGRLCLDVGASTGGFTDALLQRGAARVVAVDVGHDQLHPRLRSDPRVVSRERTDIRNLGAELAAESVARRVSLRSPLPRGEGAGGEGSSGRTEERVARPPALHPDPHPLPLSTRERGETPRSYEPSAPARRDAVGSAGGLFDLIVCDASFVPLRVVLPAALTLAAPVARLVVLVKPQFEAGRGAARKGIVRDPAVHEAVCRDAEALVESLGWRVLGVVASPILGGDGNREFLLGAERRDAPRHG